MHDIDHEFAYLKQESEEKQRKLMESRQRSTQEVNNLFQTVPINNSSLSDLEHSASENSNFYLALASGPPIQKGKENKIFLTSKLATVLDACKVSDRNAVKLLVATAEACG